MKLEMTGFKSFASRTKIEFGKGITAIVGPNGSGKSNVTEALRWVLGEQSAKSLRGGKMLDVIFSGTEKRKAMNVAEVVAHFENSDHYLDLDADEVVITRRLYRNGDSDYLINGKKKRLRDIHDLFMDTGTGRDSLSIISQGRIESIFNAKPEERRAIFEEAAGVLKYKNRKSETESKLTSTQDNLDRLEDIIFELNGQLTPLRAQRDAALKFKDLETHRQQLQLSVLVSQIESEMEKCTVAKEKLSTVLNKLLSLTASQKAFEEEISRIKEKRIQTESEIEAAQTRALTLTELKSNSEKKIELFDAEKTLFEKSNAEKSVRIEELKERQKNLQDELLTNTEKFSKLSKEEKQLIVSVKQLTKDLDVFSESPEIAMERLRKDYLELVNHEASLSNNLTRNQIEVEAITARSAENDEDERETKSKLDIIVKKLEVARGKLNALKIEIDGLLIDYEKQNLKDKKLSEEYEAAQQVQFEIMDELRKKKARLSSLEAIRENHSNFYAGVQAVMKHGFDGIIGVIADLLTFNKQYTVAFDVALGASAQNIVVENEEAARRAIRYLHDNRLGRATFLPLTTIKPREFKNYAKISNMTGFIDLAVNLVDFDKRLVDAVSHILGTTVIADNLENAQQIARMMNFSVRIVTLDGSQINPGGSFAGGAGKRNATNFAANDIVQLTREIDQVNRKLNAQEAIVKNLQEQRTQLSVLLAEQRDKGEEKRLVEREVKFEVEQLAQSKKDLQELLDLSKDASHADQLPQLEDKNQQIKSELIELSRKKEWLDAELDKVRSSTKEFNKLKNTKSDELTMAKVKLGETTSECHHYESENDRLTNEISRLKDEIGTLQSVASVSSSENDRVQFASQLAESESKLQKINVKLVSLRFEREDLSAQLEDLEGQNSASLKSQQDLTMRQNRLELEIEQLEQALKTHQLAISEDYHLSYVAAKEQSNSIEDLSQAEKQLREYERKIRALGSVNINAIEQFDSVNERYHFLNDQKADLTESKNLLLTTITEMDDEVKERFEKSFYKIKESFQLTFRQMFAGGNADLVLTSEDLLTAGIEINVQPPGKKLASLNLMSGGEKALTALALLFAILRVRTVPFVVLDEVEAALDEANVKRFGDYMNNFDSSNQFIVVTHRKGTMAASDVMYGVTMLDAGISKLVSVRLTDVMNGKENKKESA